MTPAVRARLALGRRRIARGWCQGSYRDGRTFCAIGAVMVRRADGLGTDDVTEAAVAALKRYVRPRPAGSRTRWALANWNDEPDRTQADVLALYDRALKGAKK